MCLGVARATEPKHVRSLGCKFNGSWLQWFSQRSNTCAAFLKHASRMHPAARVHYCSSFQRVELAAKHASRMHPAVRVHLLQLVPTSGTHCERAPKRARSSPEPVARLEADGAAQLPGNSAGDNLAVPAKQPSPARSGVYQTRNMPSWPLRRTP